MSGGGQDAAPDFRSLIGNIFTRRKAVEEPVDDEGPSIADRIARDFGLLGAKDEEPAPETEGDRATVSIASHPEATHADDAEHA